jgi:hypothetical protein
MILLFLTWTGGVSYCNTNHPSVSCLNAIGDDDDDDDGGCMVHNFGFRTKGFEHGVCPDKLSQVRTQEEEEEDP